MRPRPGRLGDVTDDGHRAVQRPAVQDPQLHRGQVLGLVDHDVTVGAHRVRVLVLRPWAQQFERFVEQRDVVVGEHDVGRVGPALTHQQTTLAVVEVPRGRRTQQAPRAEQVVEQLGGGQDRPHALERLSHHRFPSHPLAHHLGTLLIARRVGERLEEQLLDVTAPGVVGADPATDLVDDLGRGLRGQRQALQPVGHPQRLAQRVLAIAHGPADHPDHAGVTLDVGHLGGVGAADPDVWDQIGQHGDLHAGFAERRKDLFDVGQEQPVRSDHQHPLPLEREAVGVQQVGRPVQRHHGLARARATLDHQDSGQLRTDDAVLFGLDGPDDVGQPSRPGLLERRDQRSVTLHLSLVERLGRGTEQLVVHAQQPRAPAGEVAAATQPHRIHAGRPVEGLGERRTPVHHHRIAVLVGDRDAPDVVRLVGSRSRRCLVVAVDIGIGVDATEDQRAVADVELPEPDSHPVPDHVALVAVLERAALAVDDLVAHGRDDPLGPLQRLVGVIDVRLLGIELGMVGHSRSQGGKGGSTSVATGRADPTGAGTATAAADLLGWGDV